jgi:UDP-2,3-diacylglucosamine hydrolase
LSGKKIYFASDFHLGSPDYQSTKSRERKILNWLEEVEKDAEELFLVGDIFDYWFEYKSVVPRGYVRFLGKLAFMSDKGVKLHIFTGNHDLWIEDYFEKELNAKVYRQPLTTVLKGKKFYIAHGDGLGPGDMKYKLMKKVFTSRVNQFLYSLLHPNMASGLAFYFSRKSRGGGHKDDKFEGHEREWLIMHSKDVLLKEHFDYFIYGHRHLPLEYSLNSDSRLFYLGDWLKHDTYLVFDGENMELKTFGEDKNRKGTLEI